MGGIGSVEVLQLTIHHFQSNTLPLYVGAVYISSRDHDRYLRLQSSCLHPSLCQLIFPGVDNDGKNVRYRTILNKRRYIVAAGGVQAVQPQRGRGGGGGAARQETPAGTQGELWLVETWSRDPGPRI